MYISWQVLNEACKASPTTDGGRMYTTAAQSGSYHVKWHRISDEKPVVDRFHVKHEGTEKSIYYGIVARPPLVYLGSHPYNAGQITLEAATARTGKIPLADFDEIATAFLKNLSTNFGSKLRVSGPDAVADDKAVTAAESSLINRGKLIDPLRLKYNAYREDQFKKAGLEKLGNTGRFGWTPDDYASVFAKIEAANSLATTTTTTAEPISTTASSSVFAGTKVPLPMPKGLTLEPGPVTTLKPLEKPTTSSGAASPSPQPKPWGKLENASGNGAASSSAQPTTTKFPGPRPWTKK